MFQFKHKINLKYISHIIQDVRQVTRLPSGLPNLIPDKGSGFSKAYLPTHQKVFPKGAMSKPSTSPETTHTSIITLHF